MGSLTISVIPYFDDNFSYLIQEENGLSAVVDCGDSNPIIDFLNSNSLNLDFILATHSHYDHAGDISSLMKEYPNAKLIKPKGESRIKESGLEVTNGETIDFGSTKIAAISVPAHTNYCLSYLIEDNVFVGDALFSGGCGRLFEGDPGNLESAMDKLSALSENTKVYFGHEYTLSNLKFALSIEPSNPDLLNYYEEVNAKANRKEFTTPSTIGLEKKINPFFRVDKTDVIKVIDPNEAMSRTDRMGMLRKLKDNF